MKRATATAHASWRLTDLLDVQALQAIQDTFARAFGLPTVIVHPDGTDVTDITHRLPFCEDLTRQSPGGGPRCTGCDMAAFRESRDTSRPTIFKCWNGLYDAAIPIAPKGEVLGYFLCGQVLTAAPDPERYRATAADIGVPPDRYVQALEDVQIVPFERYEASVESMHVLARMIADQAAASIDGLRMLEEARRAEGDAAALVEELDSILEALRQVSSQPDPRSTLEAIADHLIRLIPSDSCLIYLLSEDGGTLEPAAVRDPYPEALWRHRIPVGRGVIGKVAETGLARRLDDITRDPDFTPYPGVPVEPESAIAVAMTYNDVTTGVIVLSRFQRRTFGDHDLQVLGVFSSQASVAIQVSRLAAEKADRLREERALGRLLRTVASPATLDGVLHEAAHVGMELLGADAAVLQAESGEGPARATVDLTERQAESLVSVAERELAAATEAATVAFEWRGRAALALSLGVGDARALAVWLGAAGRPWDRRLAAAIALQSALAIDRVRADERERRSLARYQQLADLVTSLVQAHDEEEVVTALLARAPETFSAPSAWIARPGVAPGTVAVALRHGRRIERLTLALDGPARVAALRLRDEHAPDATVFDAWGRAVIAGVAERTGLDVHLAEPLHLADGAMGGLFVGWASPRVRPSPEHRRMLGVLAGATGTSLARFAAHEETDSSLRARVAELESLTRLTQRIAGLADETPIVAEVLEVFVRLGGLDGAAYARRVDDDIEIRGEAGVAAERRDVIQAALRSDPGAEEMRIHAAADGTRVLVLPIVRLGDASCALAGIGPRVDDRHRGRALHMLARCAAVALENASLHARQREAISDLERRQGETAEQKDKLERILSVHETLTLAVLDGRGVGAMVKSLGRFLDAELLVLASHERVLARQPEDARIGWRPGVTAGDAPRTIVAETEAGHVVAAPAVVAGDVLAWVIARTTAPPGEIERAAVEYGALLTALDLLRERMAVEIETRLRGGFLEDLFAGEFHEARMVEQALAMGLDLREPARVYLVEPPAASGGPDPEEFFGTVADGARSWGARHVVAMRGRAVVAVIAEAAEQDGPGHFEDALRRLLDTRFPQSVFSIGVGTQCAGVADFRRSFVAARRGVDLVRGLDRPGETFSFRDDTVETMLLQSVEPDAILDFIARYVEPLEAYDRDHTLHLVHTLEVYFAAGGNLEEAARRLFVHVSTLRYRLKKVAALTGVDVRTGARSLDLQVALKASGVLRAGSRPGDPAVTRPAARRRRSR